MERNFLQTLKPWIKLVFIVVGIFSVLLASRIRESNTLFLLVSGTLIAFIAIFYPLIIQKDLAQKKQELLTIFTMPRIDGAIKLLSEIKKLINSHQGNLNSIISKGEEVREKLDDLSSFHHEINLNKILSGAIIPLLLSVFFLMNDIIFFPGPILVGGMSLDVLAILGYIFFWTGFCQTITMVYSWNEIFSEK